MNATFAVAPATVNAHPFGGGARGTRFDAFGLTGVGGAAKLLMNTKIISAKETGLGQCGEWASLERHFGVRLAFQNCHRVAAFRLDPDPAVPADFTSARSQVLNQSPLLRDC